MKNSFPNLPLLIFLLVPISNTLFAQSFAPSFQLQSGRYNSDLMIQLSTGQPNADIFYTLDGTEPDNTSTEYLAHIPIEGDGNLVTVKAITIHSSGESKVSAATYKLDYNFNPDANYLTDLTWEEYNNMMEGDWFGYTTNPWTVGYSVNLSISSEGSYNGESTTP